METKKTYITPQVETVELDNEISLALASAPPGGPGEVHNVIAVPEYFGNEPFNTNLG
jgi:hypothetical protein